MPATAVMVTMEKAEVDDGDDCDGRIATGNADLNYD